MTMRAQSETFAIASDERPDGMLDYEARTIIRDLIRVDGFEKAREKIAFYLMAEADRRRQ